MTDYFPHSLEYPCLIHPSHNTTHICIDQYCQSHPFLCSLCLNDFKSSPHSNHEHNILPLHDAIGSISQQIEERKYELDKLGQGQGQSVRGGKGVDIDSLVKKFEDAEQVLRTLDTQVRGIKSQIEKDTDNLLIEFQKRLMLNKQNLFTQIDNYQKTYIQNFQNLRQLLQPVSSFKKNLKYYSNLNNICLKIQNELKRKSTDWFLSTKKQINQIYKISSDKSQLFNEGISKMTQSIGEDFPQYKNSEITESTKMRIQYFLNENINDKLNLKGMKVVNDAVIQEEYRASNNHRIQKRFY